MAKAKKYSTTIVGRGMNSAGKQVASMSVFKNAFSKSALDELTQEQLIKLMSSVNWELYVPVETSSNDELLD